jgi:hypothetical protein
MKKYISLEHAIRKAVAEQNYKKKALDESISPVDYDKPKEVPQAFFKPVHIQPRKGEDQIPAGGPVRSRRNYEKEKSSETMHPNLKNEEKIEEEAAVIRAPTTTLPDPLEIAKSAAKTLKKNVAPFVRSFLGGAIKGGARGPAVAAASGLAATLPHWAPEAKPEDQQDVTKAREDIAQKMRRRATGVSPQTTPPPAAVSREAEKPAAAPPAPPAAVEAPKPANQNFRRQFRAGTTQQTSPQTAPAAAEVTPRDIAADKPQTQQIPGAAVPVATGAKPEDKTQAQTTVPAAVAVPLAGAAAGAGAAAQTRAATKATAATKAAEKTATAPNKRRYIELPFGSSGSASGATSAEIFNRSHVPSRISIPHKRRKAHFEETRYDIKNVARPENSRDEEIVGRPRSKYKLSKQAEIIRKVVEEQKIIIKKDKEEKMGKNPLVDTEPKLKHHTLDQESAK